MKILNYQGSKNKLLEFIDDNIENLLVDGKALLDIFNGAASVSSYFNKKTKVYSNDLEPYAFHIANYLLNNNEKLSEHQLNLLFSAIGNNISSLELKMKSFLDEEKNVIATEGDVEAFYNSIPTLWNEGFSPLLGSKITTESIKNRNNEFCLFTLLYSSNYFGLNQAIEIDSIISGIKTVFGDKKSFLYVCLFSAMNACVFSKDGHMAQPLNISKNYRRCLRVRKKSILSLFLFFIKEEEVSPRHDNRSYNLEFEALLSVINPSEISCIYADPPYTDMQYSRYYHLLNIACEYVFASPTKSKKGYSSGLYLSNRRQSQISTRKTFLPKMEKLMRFSFDNKINLVISFGYPKANSGEKTTRYLTSIDSLVNTATKVFGPDNVHLIGRDYQHANQRNSFVKKVVEYLIICRGDNHA